MGKGGDNTSHLGTNALNSTIPGDQLQQQQTTLRPGMDDFYWSASDEPHASRRKAILAKYPAIKQLYGHCPQLKYKVFLCMAIQAVCAHSFRPSSTATQSSPFWWWISFWTTAYIVGGTCNHMLMMALHELSHNLGFAKMQHNKWFAMFANIPIAVPSAVTFKRYHMEHHKYQGVDGIDVDIPTVWEGRVFQSPLAKFFFCIMQVAFYGLRPSFVNPKPPGLAEAANAAIVLTCDFLVYYFWGWSSLAYLLASSWLGMGLHPVAGHFIAEHYVFPRDIAKTAATPTAPSQLLIPETYSYYGVVNYFTFNVGYHNEHHDFPFVPGSRLPQVHAIAKEYYQVLPHHTSYMRVFYDYIFDEGVSAFSRVKRASTAPDPGGVATDRDAAKNPVLKKAE